MYIFGSRGIYLGAREKDRVVQWSDLEAMSPGESVIVESRYGDAGCTLDFVKEHGNRVARLTMREQGTTGMWRVQSLDFPFGVLLDLGFRFMDRGLAGYKLFLRHESGRRTSPCYTNPTEWDIAPGAWLKEPVDTNRFEDCSYGVNIGSMGWVKRFAETIAYESGVVPEIWNGFVPYDYMPHIVIPFESDGKIRTSCFVLSYPEFEGQMSLPDNDGDARRVIGWEPVKP